MEIPPAGPQPRLMGEHDVTATHDKEQLRNFMKRLLKDVHALERLLAEGAIESDKDRIGAEQELFLVDSTWRPAPVAQQVLARCSDPHFTTELARFNLEINLDAAEFRGGCLRSMEAQIDELLAVAGKAAAECGARVLLCGILPTLRLEDLGLENMTPIPRYSALNDAMGRMRGGPFRFRIRGADELVIQHENVMLEACNTSFQVHLQVRQEEFAHLYNIAQLVTAPVLAAAVNSPLLFGRRLWRETRIALFQQSVDVRHDALMGERRLRPRVSFGDQWIRESVLEIFREDVARFRVLIAAEKEEDPEEALASGRAPQLYALRLHNGTVYRWNRACYGVSAGRPHLRIENRVLPAGPTPVDEVANAAFWFGLMRGIAAKHDDVTQLIEFDEAKHNFLAAARLGLGAQFQWMGGATIPARELICDLLLPIAEQGLVDSGIDSGDVTRYLGVVHDRVMSGRSGAAWQLESLAGLKGRGGRTEQLAAITAAAAERQRTGRPVHTWEPARIEESGLWRDYYMRVEHIMSTDLFTVHQDELVDLAANVMDWRHIRHVPVEDDHHRLAGILTHRGLLRHFGKQQGGRPVAVGEIMHRDPISVPPETRTLDAIRLMREHRVSCLPVVREGRLIGLLTEGDLMDLAAELLEQKFRE